MKILERRVYRGPSQYAHFPVMRLTVDLGELTKGQSLHVSDIELPAGVKIVTHGKPNPVIVSANVQAAEVEEVAPAPVVAAAAPAPTKAKKTEKQNKK